MLILCVYGIQRAMSKSLVDNFEIIKRNGLIYTNQNTIKQLYKMTYVVGRILHIYNIDYWAEGGTLLGAVRHKGIIPWDEDADLQIMDKDEWKIELIKEPLERFGYEIIKTWWGYKIFPQDGKKIKGYNSKYPGLDIFVATIVEDKDGNKIIKYQYPIAQEYFGRCWSYYKDIYPIKKYKFGSFTINGPNNPHTYLNSCYGTDWNDVAYMQYDHENEVPYKKIKINLSEHDRVPGIPFYP